MFRSFNVTKRVSWKVPSRSAISESELPVGLPRDCQWQSQKEKQAALKVGPQLRARSHSASRGVGYPLFLVLSSALTM